MAESYRFTARGDFDVPVDKASERFAAIDVDLGGRSYISVAVCGTSDGRVKIILNDGDPDTPFELIDER